MDEHFFLYNDLLYRSGTPFINEHNRALKYGDGLFETMRVLQGEIINSHLHFKRFFKGLDLLKLSFSDTFSEKFLIQKINDLLQKNGLSDHARVRLMAFREEKGVDSEKNGNMNYLIEAYPADIPVTLNRSGLEVDIFEDAKKSSDRFSNIKTNNYLSNVMAMVFAKENNLDECILLNSSGRVCESTISNIFIIKNGKIHTPSLSEGCVEGIVRHWLINNLSKINMEVIERKITVEDVQDADELFFTNSIRLLRWVKKFRDKEYHNTITKEIAEFVFNTMISRKKGE